MKKGVIYKIINIVDNKLYIGKARDKSKRFYAHRNNLEKGIHPNTHLQRAWNKHGKENFKFEIIEICEYEDLLKREYFWINELSTLDENKGYNLEIPDINGKGFHSENTKNKLKEAWINRKNSEAYIKQLLQIRELGISQRGIIPKNHASIIEACKKPVIQKTLSGNIIQVHSAGADAARMLVSKGLSSSINSAKSTISECCTGKRKTSHGYRWEYGNKIIHKQPEVVGNAIDI